MALSSLCAFKKLFQMQHMRQVNIETAANACKLLYSFDHTTNLND